MVMMFDNIPKISSLLAGATVVFALGFVLLFPQWLRRAAFPPNAPKEVTEGSLFTGRLKFFSDRHKFYFQCKALSRSGNFSQYLGNHQVVGLSGLDGRRTFYEAKEMDVEEGYNLFFVTNPSLRGPAKLPINIPSYRFQTDLIRAMRTENLKKRLPFMLRSTAASINRLIDHAVPVRVIDPFEELDLAGDSNNAVV
ncbi:hypothetical protein EYZ11_010152 [Aspergillus tanneri]|uniref:Uncharacterized protein n=1 Tax=Aspergillus tanneri TaxID=1220188 RepID=A0A4S3J640_9EURO|nr:hypothetical protein EYZ11_010152 [Aspergillus tanneri]